MGGQNLVEGSNAKWMTRATNTTMKVKVAERKRRAREDDLVPKGQYNPTGSSNFKINTILR